MNIEIIEIDLAANASIDYINSIYRGSSTFLSDTFIVNVDFDGHTINRLEIKKFDKKFTKEKLQKYEVHGALSEVLVCSNDAPVVEDWELPDNLPCFFDADSKKVLERLMSKNGWNYYLGLGQTQMIIASDNHAYIDWVRKNFGS